jgi:sugar phosphate isomerase/epimerase
MDRRDFLKKSALTIAGAIVGGSVFSGLAGSTGCSAAPKNKRIGLQLYSLREMMGQNPEETLKLIATMGYKELETASYDGDKIYGYTPKDFRALVEGLGMKVTSCHIGQSWDPAREAEIMAWWEKAFEDHKALGCKYIIVPSARYGDTLESLKATCDYWNRLGAIAKKKGLTFGYHNHAHEFQKIEDQIAYDYMLQNTGNDVVFEMDVYWVTQGGYNPVDYLQKYAGRFPLLHIKDDSIIGNSGKMDFEAIFNAAYAQGMKDFYVEVEQYELPAEISVEKSYDYLEAAPFVK